MREVRGERDEYTGCGANLQIPQKYMIMCNSLQCSRKRNNEVARRKVPK